MAKVKQGETLESIAADMGVSVAQAFKYFGTWRLSKGMRYNPRRLREVRGGQALAISQGVNPWGLQAGDVPESAWETVAGTRIAEKYLGLAPGTGGPGVSPPVTGGVVGAGAPPELTPEQRAMVSGYPSPEVAPSPPAIEGDIITQPGGGFLQTGAPPGLPAPPITEAAGYIRPAAARRTVGPSAPRTQPGISVPQTGAQGLWAAQAQQRVRQQLGRGAGLIAKKTMEAAFPLGEFARETFAPSPGQPPAPFEPEPLGPISPAGWEVMAARYTFQAIREAVKQGDRNLLPNLITSGVAQHIYPLSMNLAVGEEATSFKSVQEMMENERLNYDEIEPGLWKKNPQLTYPSGIGGFYGTSGRRFPSYARGSARRRGLTQGQGAFYGPGLINWRIGFG